MPAEVALRTLRAERRALGAWSVALVLLVAMYVAVYPSVRGDSSYAKLIEGLPKAYRALITVAGGGDITTPVGYLDVELMTFMGPLLVFVYAIGAGAGALAGEEERHTLDLLLANPIRRHRVVIEKFAALFAGTAVLVAVLWAALVTEGAIAGMAVPLGGAAAAMAHLGLLGAEFGALALLVGALTGRSGPSRALPTVVAVVAYLVNALGPVVGWLRPLRPWSPFYQYIAHDPLRTGLSVPAVGVTVASIGVLVALAVAAFRRRDVT